ncbi:MAG: zinc ABC transporter substrate-binding protein [Candidatus Andersenbacteria bacterium]
MKSPGLKLFWFGLIVVVLGTGIVWYARSNRAPRDTRLSVSASFYPLAFFAEQIGGGKIMVTNLTPAGAEPHEYELTPQQVATVVSSRLLLLNGAGLEPWAADVTSNLDQTQTRVLVTGQDLATQTVVEEGQTVTDPHVWLSPVLAQKITDRIAQALQEIDPANADLYDRNAAQLKSRLVKLDTAYRTGLASCQQHDLITTHVAFGYLASTYKLNQVALTGISPEAEPSPQQLADLAEFARVNKIRYIFFESLVSPKLAETLAQEVGAQTLVLDPLEGLHQDDLAAGKNYFTQMEDNLHNLQTALGCQS